MMRAIQITFALLVLSTGAVNAREGYVRTRSGVVFDGHLRFESNSVVVVNVPLATRTVVALTNLAELLFLSGTEDASMSVFREEASHENLPLPWVSEDVGQVAVPGAVRVQRKPGGYGAPGRTRSVQPTGVISFSNRRETAPNWWLVWWARPGRIHGRGLA